MSNAEIQYLMDAIEQTALLFRQWMKAYYYDRASNEFLFNGSQKEDPSTLEDWFNLGSFTENKIGQTN
jgi:hypothetical protein